MENNSKTKIIYTAILVVLLLVITGVYIYRKNSMNVVIETPVSQNNNAATSTSGSNTGKLSGYKNGSYSITASYISPAGAESFGLQIDLANNIIINAVMTPLATNPISTKIQDGFQKGFKPLVVGKSIDDVNLDKVSGASLTTKGFNDALEKIKVLADQNA